MPNNTAIDKHSMLFLMQVVYGCCFNSPVQLCAILKRFENVCKSMGNKKKTWKHVKFHSFIFTIIQEKTVALLSDWHSYKFRPYICKQKHTIPEAV